MYRKLGNYRLKIYFSIQNSFRISLEVILVIISTNYDLVCEI